MFRLFSGFFPILLFASLTTYLSSCEQAGLKANKAKGQSDQGSGDASPESCIEGDQINLKFPEEIQSCIDKGRLYNFATDECLEVSLANFECSFEAMEKQVSAIGVNSESIIAAQKEGALLVACGEKNEGKTIVAQWYYPLNPIDSCADENPASRIVTACYKIQEPGNLPPLETEEQRRQAIQACLND